MLDVQMRADVLEQTCSTDGKRQNCTQNFKSEEKSVWSLILKRMTAFSRCPFRYHLQSWSSCDYLTSDGRPKQDAHHFYAIDQLTGGDRTRVICVAVRRLSNPSHFRKHASPCHNNNIWEEPVDPQCRPERRFRTESSRILKFAYSEYIQ
jgi:hypothetical protein